MCYADGEGLVSLGFLGFGFGFWRGGGKVWGDSKEEEKEKEKGGGGKTGGVKSSFGFLGGVG